MRLWLGVPFLALWLPLPTGGSETEPLSGVSKIIAQKIDFKITVESTDPFALSNRAGAVPSPAGLDVIPGEVVRVTIHGKPKDGHYTYPATKDPLIGARSTIEFKDKSLFLPLPPLTESKWDVVDDEPKHHKPFTWTQDVYVRPTAKPGPQALRVAVRLQVCKEACYGPDYYPTLSVPVNVLNETPSTASADLKKRIDAAERPSTAPLTRTTPEPKTGAADSGLLAFLFAAVGWGILSLLTPCVLPMLPITVSFFLKQSESAHHRPATMALVYCSTIVLVLTVGGLLFFAVLLQLISFWPTQFFLAGLCLFFALSLLGMYEIQLPSWLSNLTATQEGRGGLAGTIFMALTFTIVSFACVGPYYGFFIAGAAAAQSASDWLRPILGTLVFSVTFAAPFFFLAIFPTLLRKMPKSGSWMTTMKVVMGFIVLAVALKFLRAGEILWQGKAEFLTYDLVLGMIIALSLLCGLYLLALYRLPHDDPSEHLGVPRVLISMLFLGLGFYLLPNLFHDNSGEKPPRGGTVLAWVDGFILTDRGEGGLPWTTNLDDGLKQAQQKGGLVFIDFTGLD